MRIIVTNRLPKDTIGTRVRPLMPHPIAAWIERKLTGRVTPVMMISGGPIEVDVAYGVGDLMFVTAAQYRELRDQEFRVPSEFLERAISARYDPEMDAVTMRGASGAKFTYEEIEDREVIKIKTEFAFGRSMFKESQIFSMGSAT